VNEIAASTAATVNKWRIGRFLVYVGAFLAKLAIRVSNVGKLSRARNATTQRKDKRGDTPTAQDKLSPRNCPRAERSTFKRAVWRLVSSSGRLPMVKQNRYNRHGLPEGATASWAVYSAWSARGHASRRVRWVHSSLASVRHEIVVGGVHATGNHRWRAVVRTVATARARMIVHPVGHETIAIDARKQVFRRAIMAAAAANAKRYQHRQHHSFQCAIHSNQQTDITTLSSTPTAQFSSSV
jgi:hypothetical protein